MNLRNSSSDSGHEWEAKGKQAEFHIPLGLICACAVMVMLGGAALISGLRESPDRVWPNVLLVGFYLVSLGLAGMVFVALQYVSGAGWSVGIRRVPEAMIGGILLGVVGLGLVFLAKPSLYPWITEPVGESATPLRRAWYTYPSFLTRAAIYIASWLILGFAMFRNSRCQDRDYSLGRTRRNVHLSAAFLVVFGVTFWLACSDWLMSLEPDWSSTMFGVYQFAGLFLAGLAVIILFSAVLLWLGPFRGILIKDHIHDLGKLLFGFSTFWMYLWVFQYMLIWSVNNPEETSYFTRRLHGSWRTLFIVNIVVNWGIPFLVLLPRSSKRSIGILFTVSLLVLAGRWLDLYIAILPYSGEPTLTNLTWEAGLPIGAVGLFALVFFVVLRTAHVFPVGDPFLSESVSNMSGCGYGASKIN
jgi:hypothetical protein